MFIANTSASPGEAVGLILLIQGILSYARGYSREVLRRRYEMGLDVIGPSPCVVAASGDVQNPTHCFNGKGHLLGDGRELHSFVKKVAAAFKMSRSIERR